MIENYIPEGKEHAIKREALVEHTGMTDRQVRREIEEARRSGIVILNDCDGGGYYITDDIKAIKKAYDRETARALSIFKTRRTLRNKLKEAGYPVRK